MTRNHETQVEFGMTLISRGTVWFVLVPGNYEVTFCTYRMCMPFTHKHRTVPKGLLVWDEDAKCLRHLWDILEDADKARRAT